MSLNRIQIVLFLVVSTGLAAQDASAYYAPEMGRFISRDPIGYRAKDVNLHRYTSNRVTTRTDKFGLLSKEQIGACCAPHRGLAALDVRGITMCCCSQVIICNLVGSSNLSPRAKKIVDDCTDKHELSHASDIDCRGKGTSKEPSEIMGDPEKEKASECKAYRTSLKCLENSRQKCGSDRTCLGEIDREINANEQGERVNCPREGDVAPPFIPGTQSDPPPPLPPMFQ